MSFAVGQADAHDLFSEIQVPGLRVIGSTGSQQAIWKLSGHAMATVGTGANNTNNHNNHNHSHKPNPNMTATATTTRDGLLCSVLGRWLRVNPAPYYDYSIIYPPKPSSSY